MHSVVEYFCLGLLVSVLVLIDMEKFFGELYEYIINTVLSQLTLLNDSMNSMTFISNNFFLP